jgi:hypothetical protein
MYLSESGGVAASTRSSTFRRRKGWIPASATAEKDVFHSQRLLSSMLTHRKEVLLEDALTWVCMGPSLNFLGVVGSERTKYSDVKWLKQM